MEWGAEGKHFAFLRLRYLSFIYTVFQLVQVYVLLVMGNREKVLQLHKMDFNFIFLRQGWGEP